jgi:hypothetical protein
VDDDVPEAGEAFQFHDDLSGESCVTSWRIASV